MFWETTWIVGNMCARYVYMCDDEVCALIDYSQLLRFGWLWYLTIASKYLRRLLMRDMCVLRDDLSCWKCARYVCMCDDEVCALIDYSQRLWFGWLWYLTIAGKYLSRLLMRDMCVLRDDLNCGKYVCALCIYVWRWSVCIDWLLTATAIWLIVVLDYSG